MTSSVLDELPGVGPARKRALLRHFGSPEAVAGGLQRAAPGVPGVPPKVGRELYGTCTAPARPDARPSGAAPGTEDCGPRPPRAATISSTWP